MVVVVVVGGADELLGDSVTKENAEDAVLDGVGLVLVEGEEDEGVVHEVGVVQEGGKELLQPDTGNGDGGVVTIRSHVGSC